MSNKRTILSLVIASMGSGGVIEGTESYFVNLSNPINATISDGQGIGTITQIGTLNPIINVNRTTGVNSLHVQFDASSTQAMAPVSNRVFHELQFDWDFGDDIAAVWGYGPQAGNANKNFAYGPIAGHVFETAGIKTVTLTVKDPSGLLSSTSRTIEIVVTDADTVFSGTNTVCLSTGTDFTGAPVGSSNIPNATIANIQSSLLSGKRVLLKRGDIWDSSSSLTINSTTGIFGAFGSGNKPRINMIGTVADLILTVATDWRIVDIELTSDGVYSAGKGGVSVTDSTNNLFLRCDISQGRNNFTAANSNGLGIFDSVIHDCFTTAGICAYIDKVDNLAIYGNWMYMSTDHVCRVQGTAITAISYNNFERPSVLSGCALTVRGKANDSNVDLWNGLWTEWVCISDNYCTTSSVRGGDALAVKPQAVGHAERLRHIIIERNVLTSEDSPTLETLVSHNLTIRNNIIISRYSYGISFGYGSVSTDIVPPPDSIWVYNNTIYKPDTVYINGFSAVVLTNTTEITGLVIKNNLSYSPADTRDGYTNGIAPSFFSSNTATEGVHYTLSGNSTNIQVKTINPFVTSNPDNLFTTSSDVIVTQFTPVLYAVNSGEYVPVYRDLLSNILTGARDKGAIQA